MATTQTDIQKWFEEAVAEGDDFMMVVCDTYDWSDYPVSCSEKDFGKEYAKRNGTNMQKIMEVYDLSKDMQEQLNMPRCFNYPASWDRV